MNLDLTLSQRQLADAVAKAARTAHESDDGWSVLVAALPPDRPAERLRLLDWCLALEELGAGLRDLEAVRAARRRLDAVRGAGTDDDTRSGPLGAERLADRDRIACAAYAVGVGRRCLELAQRRAGDRTVAGRPLIEHQGVAHRLAGAAFASADARIGLWSVAYGEDDGRPAGHRAPAAAAVCVAAAVHCAHELVQIFGAAGTSDAQIVRLYDAAYATAPRCGAPGSLWQSAGQRWMTATAAAPHAG